MMKIILTGEKPFIDEILDYATSRYKEFTDNSGEVVLENPGLVEFFRNSYESLRTNISVLVKKELTYNIVS